MIGMTNEPYCCVYSVTFAMSAKRQSSLEEAACDKAPFPTMKTIADSLRESRTSWARWPQRGVPFTIYELSMFMRNLMFI